MSIPVILDTDIGFDVDDVWAMALLLNCPELDVKLVTTTTGDTAYRARLTAKLLEVAGCEDTPIGIGIPLDASPRTHSDWLGDYDLADYAGPVYRDGVGAICDVITGSEEPVTVIAIGPLPNLAAALAREPDIQANARFVGMHGSLRRGYLGANKPMREYNVKQHALSCQAVLSASWPKLITPLDTCGNVILDGTRFQKIAASENKLTQAVLENHFGWFKAVSDWPVLQDINPQQQSSILYDAVAIYLAVLDGRLDEDSVLNPARSDWVEIETLPVKVTEDGKTLIDEAGGVAVDCATSWHDEEAFLDFITERLCG